MTISRAEHIERLKTETFDLVIIGGGATGAGAVLDAASRGLKVALIERADFASGTSSKSTKLVHGGVRYLEQAFKTFDMEHLALVREALAERKTVLSIAPHLTRALPLLIPLYKRWQIPYYFVGLWLYDLLAGFRSIGRSHFLSVKKINRRFPALNTDGMTGGIVYYDGQFNDARMNVELVMTATQHGAAVANYVRVDTLEKQDGTLHGCQVTDTISGESFSIQAKGVINATGPFADTIRTMDDSEAQPMVRTSSGTHIMVPGTVCPDDLGMLIPKTSDGRVIFVLPWQGVTLIGTTDDDAPLTDNPQPTEEEILFLLKQVNGYFKTELKRRDVMAAWTGLRPLVSKTPGGSTASLSRSHVIHTSDSGLMTITGGKWTTYRNMAEDVVDAAVKQFGLSASPCQTATTTLIGGEGYSEALSETLAREHDLEAEVAIHLADTYGGRAHAVLALAGEDERLMQRLCDHHPYIAAEALYALRYEMAQTLDDVLARRLRLRFIDEEAAEHAAGVLAGLMEGELAA